MFRWCCIAAIDICVSLPRLSIDLFLGCPNRRHLHSCFCFCCYWPVVLLTATPPSRSNELLLLLLAACCVQVIWILCTSSAPFFCHFIVAVVHSLLRLRPKYYFTFALFTAFCCSGQLSPQPPSEVVVVSLHSHRPAATFCLFHPMPHRHSPWIQHNTTTTTTTTNSASRTTSRSAGNGRPLL